VALLQFPTVAGAQDTDRAPLPGRYELLVTERLARSSANFGRRARWRPLARGETAAHLTRHLKHVFARVLHSHGLEDHIQQQIELCNQLIAPLDDLTAPDTLLSQEAVTRAELLMAVGFTVGLQKALPHLLADSTLADVVANPALQYAAKPSVLGAANHLLSVGRRHLLDNRLNTSLRWTFESHI
jgi:hypothetical protein